MSDLISRADAIEAIASRDETDGTVKVFTGREVNEILSALPSEEPKTGRWVFDECGYFRCEVCGKKPNDQNTTTDYCPYCGARLGGDTE